MKRCCPNPPVGCGGTGTVHDGALDAWKPCPTCCGEGEIDESAAQGSAIRHSWSQAIAEQRAALRAVNEDKA